MNGTDAQVMGFWFSQKATLGPRGPPQWAPNSCLPGSSMDYCIFSSLKWHIGEGNPLILNKSQHDMTSICINFLVTSLSVYSLWLVIYFIMFFANLFWQVDHLSSMAKRQSLSGSPSKLCSPCLRSASLTRQQWDHRLVPTDSGCVATTNACCFLSSSPDQVLQWILLERRLAPPRSQCSIWNSKYVACILYKFIYCIGSSKYSRINKLKCCVSQGPKAITSRIFRIMYADINTGVVPPARRRKDLSWSWNSWAKKWVKKKNGFVHGFYHS